MIAGPALGLAAKTVLHRLCLAVALVAPGLLCNCSSTGNQPVQPDLEAGKRAYESGDYAGALREFERLAGLRNAEAQNYLAVMYDRGLGVPQDTLKALEWRKRAADLGHPEAQLTLGTLYATGSDAVPQNLAGAYLWLTLASIHGRDEALQPLAEIEPRLTPEQRASAQNDLGTAFVVGRAAPRDLERGFDYYRKSDGLGHPEAPNNIGVFYERGMLGSPDAVEALRWYHKSAERDDSNAQFNLGRVYRDGLGTDPDPIRAHMWFNLASRQRHAKALYSMNQLAEKMTPQQVTEAQALAEAWASGDKSAGAAPVAVAP